MDNNSCTVGKNKVDGVGNTWNIFMVPRPAVPVFCNMLKNAKKDNWAGSQLNFSVLFSQSEFKFVLLANRCMHNLGRISFMALTICNPKNQESFSIYDTAM